MEGKERRSQKSGESNTKLAIQRDAPRGTFMRRIRSVSETIWFLTCLLLTILNIAIASIEAEPCLLFT